MKKWTLNVYFFVGFIYCNILLCGTWIPAFAGMTRHKILLRYSSLRFNLSEIILGLYFCSFGYFLINYLAAATIFETR